MIRPAFVQQQKGRLRGLWSFTESSASVASEGRLRDAGSQEPECTRQYMRIPSTAGAQDAERSSSQEIQRWRALKRGLLLQITNTLPRRRTTLQSRCRCFADFRDESTFTADSSIEVRPGSACHGWRALWLLLIFAFRDERMDIGLKQAGKCSASKGLRQA